jgi:hypothetical protein
MKPDFEKMGREIASKLDGKFEKYIPHLEAWGNSPAVRIKKWHDERMAKSEMGRDFADSLHVVEEDLSQIHWAAGFDQDGYKEWIKNEDLAMLLEDVYQVKEAFKALVTSKMAMVNGHIGKAVFKNKHFKKIVELFFEDMGVDSWEELEVKLHDMAMRAAAKMEKCPKAQKLFKQVKRLMKMAIRTREVFDMPSEDDVMAWVKKNDFQPWI